jgi:O-antigen ligase
MHTHHQIFHTWLDTGILGVLSLLMMMIVFAKNFWQQKHTMGLALLLLFVLNLLTDDMLEVQAGLVFFVMFFCLFLFQPQAARD